MDWMRRLLGGRGQKRDAFVRRPMMGKSFRDIGRSTGTDKVTHHGYHRFYPFFLELMRDQPITMLEIGTQKNKSLRLWEQYFPHATIYGVDIGNGFKFARGEVFKGDQGDRAFLETVMHNIGKRVELIVDDGSHKPEHQLDTFILLFDQLLKDGGIYIIEDIETNYWTKGTCYGYQIERGFGHQDSVIEIFKNIVDLTNIEFVKDRSVFDRSPLPANVRDQIALVSFQYNSIIVVKKDAESAEYENRKYRMAEFL